MMRFFDPTPDSALRPYLPTLSFELNQHYATVNTFDRLSNAQVLVDMELYVFDPIVRFSWRSKLEISLQTPILRPFQGVFDSPIQRFHGWFNFPNGGRELRPNNQYDYALHHDRGAQWQSRPRWELGNVEIAGRYHLVGHQSWAIAALAAVKLPTASQSRGWGSGAVDIGAGLVLSVHQGDWSSHIEGWLIQPFAKDVSGISYTRYVRGSITMAYQVFDPVAVVVQTQGGLSPYQSQIAALDHPPFLISFGLRGVHAEGWGWNVSIVENISQVTTQDISIAAGVRWSIR